MLPFPSNPCAICAVCEQSDALPYFLILADCRPHSFKRPSLSIYRGAVVLGCIFLIRLDEINISALLVELRSFLMERVRAGTLSPLLSGNAGLSSAKICSRASSLCF